jgi:hypothetical protein
VRVDAPAARIGLSIRLGDNAFEGSDAVAPAGDTAPTNVNNHR